MTERRFWFGLITTLLWLSVMAALFYWSNTTASSMKPNEWGDFFAGVFAPLAFLWLVLGYLQQGEELRLSTKALTLQAEELKNSVEQQRELVEVTRQQVESEKEALAYERRQREEEAKPSFVVSTRGGSFHGDGRCSYPITVANTGNAATAVMAQVVTAGSRTPMFDMALFERGRTQGINFETPRPLEPDTAQLHLNFRDLLGRQYEIAYALQRASGDPQSSLTVTLISAKQA